MRKRTGILLGAIGLICAPLGVLAFEFAGMPEQPARPAMARVVAIKAAEGKWSTDRDTVVVRNAHGTGSFNIWEGQLRCHVGDLVSVEQRGTTLRALPKTCR